MKIGFDVAQTCTEKAGCAWYADALLRALVAVAPDDHFFVYHQFGDWINEQTDYGTHVVAPNVTETFTDVSPFEAARIWKSPDELKIKTGSPDIVHANCFQAPKVPGAKLIYTIYDVSFWAVPRFTTEANRLICQQGVLEALRNADGFIFISESSLSEFERLLPGWLRDANVPYAVTPLAPRAARDVRSWSEPSHWLAVGSLEPRKNYETLLDAFDLYWTRSPVQLPLQIAGGRGWKSEHLHARLRTMMATGKAQYLGYVADEKLPDLYTAAQALIFPSWYEGFGLPVVEAMATGCPVICSSNTSLQEAGGEAAIYIDPSNAQSIAEAMLRLEASPALRDSARRQGLARAQRFSWFEAARRSLALYEQVLRSPRRR